MEQRFTVDSAGLAQCQEFVAARCASPRPKIIMDEIVSNIVRCSGATFFTVDIAETAPKTLTIVFTDDGAAFNPLEVATPDITAAATEREIGGLGIFMVKKMSRSVNYERRGQLNVLTVVMPF